MKHLEIGEVFICPGPNYYYLVQKIYANEKHRGIALMYNGRSFYHFSSLEVFIGIDETKGLVEVMDQIGRVLRRATEEETANFKFHIALDKLQ